MGVLCLSLGLLQAQAQFSDVEVKAAYLSHFGEYMSLSADVSGTKPASFDICVVGDDPIGPALAHIAVDEQLGGRPVRILLNKNAADARSCSIAYISASEGTRTERDLAALAGDDALTVSDAPAFLEHGGMIQFVLQENRVRFLVNLDAVYRTHVRLSAFLLRVAAMVRGKSQPGVAP